MKKKKEEYIDDGRTIANMNVDGMPWYNSTRDSQSSSDDRYKPTKGETMYILLGVLKAALFIALIFAVVFLAFIIFADNIWLK